MYFSLKRKERKKRKKGKDLTRQRELFSVSERLDLSRASTYFDILFECCVYDEHDFTTTHDLFANSEKKKRHSNAAGFGSVAHLEYVMRLSNI